MAFKLSTFTDCVPTCIALVCHTQSAAQVRQAQEHVLQFCPLYKEARIQHCPQGARLAENLCGFKEDLLQTKSINTIKLLNA